MNTITARTAQTPITEPSASPYAALAQAIQAGLVRYDALDKQTLLRLGAFACRQTYKAARLSLEKAAWMQMCEQCYDTARTMHGHESI